VRCIAAVGQEPDDPILAADGEGGGADGHLGAEELVEAVAHRALGRSGAVRPVVWTSLGPLPRWVPGPTTRWAPGTT
jgi:hypothetical protein